VLAQAAVTVLLAEFEYHGLRGSVVPA
jgi:hypothetical protein